MEVSNLGQIQGPWDSGDLVPNPDSWASLFKRLTEGSKQSMHSQKIISRLKEVLIGKNIFSFDSLFTSISVFKKIYFYYEAENGLKNAADKTKSDQM